MKKYTVIQEIRGDGYQSESNVLIKRVLAEDQWEADIKSRESGSNWHTITVAVFAGHRRDVLSHKQMELPLPCVTPVFIEP